MKLLNLAFFVGLVLFGGAAVADNQEQQKNMNLFYAPENILTLEIAMDEADWLKVKNAEPNGGCSKTYIGHRYDWVKAKAMDVQGSIEREKYQYLDIAIKKKSACGSKDSTKPSFNINLSKYNDNNDSKAKEEIGTTHLTLNNSKQDDSIIKQCFGYHLFREAGLAASRCNFASIYMNTAEGRTYLGIYVNVEPIKKNYLKNPANNLAHSDNGYLYEVDEHDFDMDGVIYNGYKGYSDVDDYIRVDYAMTADTIQGGNNVWGIDSAFDRDLFMSYWAMEVFIQHWDGYTRNVKNAYAYNDTDIEAVDDSDEGFSLQNGSVAFKFLPWGIDQIMQTPSCRQVYHCADVSSGLYNTPQGQTDIQNSINNLVDNFGKKETAIIVYLKLLGLSAQKTLGNKTDPLTGATAKTIAQGEESLENWFRDAISDGPISTTCCNYNSCSSTRCF